MSDDGLTDEMRQKIKDSFAAGAEIADTIVSRFSVRALNCAFAESNMYSNAMACAMSYDERMSAREKKQVTTMQDTIKQHHAVLLSVMSKLITDNADDRKAFCLLADQIAARAVHVFNN